MKRIFKLLLIPVLVLSVLYGCTEGFEAANKNPNKSDVAEPQYLFGLSPVRTLRILGSNSNWFFFGNYTNQMSVIGGSGPHFGKDGRSDGLWQNFYTQVLLPLISIEKNFGETEAHPANPAYAHRVAIAKIWKSYVFSQMVAMWGPLPYTNACNEGPYMEFDSEETIYRGIFADLESAIAALAVAPQAGDAYPPEAEPFLQADVARWLQFAHCIRLRVAVRLVEVPNNLAPGLANDALVKLQDELSHPENLIANNDGNFYLKFTADEANQNPFYREILQDPNLETGDTGNYPIIHEAMTMWLVPYKDPFTTGAGNKRYINAPKNPIRNYVAYFGRPSMTAEPQGYDWPTGKTSPYNIKLLYTNYATVGNDFIGMTASFPIFTYPEIVGYQAEAAYKGWYTGGKSAEDYYYDLIDARCTRFGSTGKNVDNYKAFPGIAWSTPADTADSKTVKRSEFFDYQELMTSYLGGEEDNYKRIIVQEWINFFYQGIDSWTLLRRTQVMTFKPHWQADISTAYVNSTWAYAPNRLKYPGAEIARNTAATQAAVDNLLFDNTLKDPEDQIPFKLIFCKDIQGLKDVHLGKNEALKSYPDMARNRPVVTP